jgi:predicted Zn-dependent protease
MIKNTVLRKLCCAVLGVIHTASFSIDISQIDERSSVGWIQEAHWGAEIVRRYDQTGKVLHVPMLESYVQGLGDRLARSSNWQQTHMPLKIFLVDDPSINAFALPGGWIGIHTGLISAAEDESELAGVLAHELAHVVQRHHERGQISAQKNQWIVLASVLAAGALAATGLGLPALASMNAGLAGAVQKNLNYSRSLEQEADSVGLDMLKQAGFDPYGMPRFFNRLYQSQKFRERKELSFLYTHPLSQDRISDTMNRLHGAPQDDPKPSPEFLMWREITRQLTKQEPFGEDTFAKAVAQAQRGLSVDFSLWKDSTAGKYMMLSTQNMTAWPATDSSSVMAQTRFDRLFALNHIAEAKKLLDAYQKNSQVNDAGWFDRQARLLALESSTIPMHFAMGEAARLRGDVRYATEQYCVIMSQPKEKYSEYWAQRAKARVIPWRGMDMGDDLDGARLRACIKQYVF